MHKFYMCLVAGTEATRKRWAVENEARTEAERLTRETGQPTFLLETVAVCSPTKPLVPPVQWDEL